MKTKEIRDLVEWGIKQGLIRPADTEPDGNPVEDAEIAGARLSWGNTCRTRPVGSGDSDK